MAFISGTSADSEARLTGHAFRPDLAVIVSVGVRAEPSPVSVPARKERASSPFSGVTAFWAKGG